MVVATVWERLSAYLVDSFGVGLLGLAFAFAGGGAIALVLVIVNEVVLVTATGASAGKLLFKMRIIRDVGGERIDFGRAVARWAVKGGAVALVVALTDVTALRLVLLWPLVDLLPILLRPDRRAVHDLAAGTLVVRAS